MTWVITIIYSFIVKNRNHPIVTCLIEVYLKCWEDCELTVNRDSRCLYDKWEEMKKERAWLNDSESFAQWSICRLYLYNTPGAAALHLFTCVPSTHWFTVLTSAHLESLPADKHVVPLDCTRVARECFGSVKCRDAMSSWRYGSAPVGLGLMTINVPRVNDWHSCPHHLSLQRLYLPHHRCGPRSLTLYVQANKHAVHLFKNFTCYHK